MEISLKGNNLQLSTKSLPSGRFGGGPPPNQKAPLLLERGWGEAVGALSFSYPSWLGPPEA